MDPEVKALAARYRSQRSDRRDVTTAVRELYLRHLRQREAALLDAAAATAAVNALFLADRIDLSRVTPQMEEAFRLAYPHVELSSLADRSAEEVAGFLSAWKGKYFEVLVRDALNRGEWVGDLRLLPGQQAVLATSPTQPGWDLQILEADGSVARELQLKATDSLAYLKQALERYPDIEVVTTDEVLAGAGRVPDSVMPSGLSDASLEQSVEAPVEALLDSPLEDLLEGLLPGLPFLIIVVGEGRRVLVGRKSFEVALADGAQRAVKSAAAMGVGGLVAWMDGGFVSLPAAFLTRLGIDRWQIMTRITAELDRKTERLRALTSGT